MKKRTGRPFEKTGENFLNVRNALRYFFPVLGEKEVEYLTCFSPETGKK